MSIPKSLKRWINCLTLLFCLISVSSYTGVIAPMIWLVFLTPLAVLFVIVTLNMVFKFILIDVDLENLRALNGLYQMEREDE